MSVVTEEDAAVTVEQFEKEINVLIGERLRSKAIAFNKQRFVDSLIEDGFNMDDIHRIFKAFARRFVATGQRAPETGSVNLFRIGQGMR